MKIKEILKNKLRVYLNYLIIFLSVFLALSLVKNVSRVSRADLKIKQAEEKVARLKEENKKLESELKEVQSTEFIEMQIRDKLGLAKEGEIVVILPDEEILRKLAPKYEEEKDVLPDPNWKRWVRLFGF